jgi:hypothetical protein
LNMHHGALWQRRTVRQRKFNNRIAHPVLLNSLLGTLKLPALFSRIYTVAYDQWQTYTVDYDFLLLKHHNCSVPNARDDRTALAGTIDPYVEGFLPFYLCR